MRFGLAIASLVLAGILLILGIGQRTFLAGPSEIAYAVDEATIAGNLKEMLLGIEAIGCDVDPRSHIATGSILIGRMTVAGGE